MSRKRVLKEHHDLSFNKLLEIALIIETADYQLNDYTKAKDTTHLTDDDISIEHKHIIALDVE